MAKKVTSVRLDEEYIQTLKSLKINVSALVESLVHDYLNDTDKNKTELQIKLKELQAQSVELHSRMAVIKTIIQKRKDEAYQKILDESTLL
jgi:6-pyruvoyl-tetrahydropterin synthase